MKYDQRSLKAVNLFAMALAALGLLLMVLIALMPAVPVKKTDPAVKLQKIDASMVKTADPVLVEDVKAPIKGKGKTVTSMSGRIPMALLAIVFLCLGAALNLQLLRVKKNKGEDPEEDSQ